MAKYQNEFQRALWQENNAYNTPAMQMERFKAAGLNPNLIYGKGTPGNATMSTAARVQPADARFSAPVNLSNALNAYFQTRLLKAKVGQEEAKEVRDKWLYTQKTEKEVIIGAKMEGGKLQKYKQTVEVDPAYMRNYVANEHLTKSKEYQVWENIELMNSRIEQIDVSNTYTRANTDFIKFKTQLNKEGFTLNDDIQYRMAYSAMTENGTKPFPVWSKTAIASAAAFGAGLKVATPLTRGGFGAGFGAKGGFTNPRRSATGGGVTGKAIKDADYGRTFRGYSRDATLDNWE